nr:integrase, catalytic region, zinc finger, CCHC-type, peptidase aspartic, catalytic [Tanacetum cinerariifolium]
MSIIISDNDVPKASAFKKYAIDVEHIPPYNRNNRLAHQTYLNRLKDSLDTLQEIIKENRIAKPLDNVVAYAYTYTKRSQEFLEYVIGTCRKLGNKQDRFIASTPLRVNIDTKASGSKPRINTKNDRTTPAKSVRKKKVEDHIRNNKSNLNKRIVLILVLALSVVQIVLWYLDSGYSKHMTGDRSWLRNFMKKFIGPGRFGNNHFGAMMGYGDYVISDSVISRVYYVEGLGYNLSSVGQFCDSVLEVAFKKHTCFVRDLDGVDLIKGTRGTNLYTIIVEDMMRSSPICVLSKASKNKSWL